MDIVLFYRNYTWFKTKDFVILFKMSKENSLKGKQKQSDINCKV